MNLWQLERQLKFLLKAATWPDPPNQAILTDAVVSPDGLGNFLGGIFADDEAPQLNLPFAVIEIRKGESQAEPLGRVILRARVWVVAGGKGITNETGNVDPVDAHGEAALVGGLRDLTGGGLTHQGKSKGRGVDEVLLDLLGQAFGTGGQTQNSVHGFQGRVTLGDEIVAVDGSQVVARAAELEIYTGTESRYYHRAWALKATNGAGQVALAWRLPPARFDTGVGAQVLRRSAAGGAVPASPIDGVGVAVAPAQAAVVVGGLGGGVYQFALFSAYDETGSGAAERYSDPAVVAGTAT